MNREDLKVKLASFEGPLDLLLYLARQNEVDIATIKISEITDYYLKTLELMKELNLDIAGDFTLMASTLIHIKSKKLLPHSRKKAINTKMQLALLHLKLALLKEYLFTGYLKKINLEKSTTM